MLQETKYGKRIPLTNDIPKWITIETKYGKRIPLTYDIPKLYNTMETIIMETKYGKRIPLTNDIPTLLQWKQNMERDSYHCNIC